MDAARIQVDIVKGLGAFRLQARFTAGSGVTALFGPSGAGKTTLLHAIAGLLRPDAGEIVLDGTTFFRRGRPGPPVEVPTRRRRVGYVFQQYLLFPHLTVLENVAFALWGEPEARRRALALLERMQIPRLADRYPDQLSGGQQQRVALARALAPDPRLLLLDEPFAALDLELRRALRQEVRDLLTASGVPILLVTHEAEEALALADTVLVLDQGQIVARGDPLALLGHPAQERVARLVGVENLLRLTVERVHPHEGVMSCRIGEVSLEVPLAGARPGEGVTVGIRAADIILAREEPGGLSARNRLRGTVTRIEPRPPGYDVTLECGLPLVCHVTQRALEEVGIRPGATVWAVIKASSCYVLQEPWPLKPP